MIKAVIFDFFGVLTEDGWLAFLSQYASAGDVEELRFLNHQTSRGELNYQDFLKQVCDITSVDQATAHKLISANHHPNDQLFTYIGKLKDAGYKLGIISNAGAELSEYMDAAYLTVFDQITLSYHEASIKPEAAIYEAHLEKLGTPPAESVFVDDRSINVAGAKRVGMKAILYQDVEQLKAALAALGVDLK